MVIQKAIWRKHQDLGKQLGRGALAWLSTKTDPKIRMYMQMTLMGTRKERQGREGSQERGQVEIVPLGGFKEPRETSRTQLTQLSTTLQC